MVFDLVSNPSISKASCKQLARASIDLGRNNPDLFDSCYENVRIMLASDPSLKRDWLLRHWVERTDSDRVKFLSLFNEDAD